jgi:RecB family exonuclease
MPSTLASICRENVLREKILIVPSLAIGHQIADAVAHGGTPWVNLRAETVRTLADAVAGFAIASDGMTVLSRAQALALVERACDEALDSNTSYFAALKDRPGLHRAVQTSIDDLRHAGVAPMAESAFEDPRKAADLVRILAAYERQLEQGRFVDRFGILTRAIAMLEGGVARPWPLDAIWMVVDEMDLTVAEERFLDLASGGSLQTVQSPQSRQSPQSVQSTHSAESAQSTQSAQSIAVPDVDFRRAAGEENEVRGAFRAILGEAIPFDDAEIVYTVREPYLPLTFELAAEHDVPCTFADGIASQYTRPGQAVLHFLQWMGEGWHAVHLQQAARTGVLSLGKDTIGARAFARVLRSAAIGWGRDRHLTRLDVSIAERTASLKEEEDPGRRERIERAIEEIGQARVVIERLLAITAEVASGEELDPAAAARAAQHFIAGFASIRNEIDGMASAGLQRMLEELAALPAMTAPRAVVTSRVAEAVMQLHVAASNPRPGHLHVAPIRAGGWSARRRMFIVGADDSRHPGRGLQDPIVLDSERSALNEGAASRPLPLLGDVPRRTTERFERLIARSGSRRVSISFSEFDLKERRGHFPAPVFLDLYRRTSGNADALYRDVEQSVAVDGFVSPRPLSGSEWWLMRLFQDHDPELRAAVLSAYPPLASGAEAEAARASDQLTKWDGRFTPINVPAEELDPRRNGRIYSASQLETMASCPYRYFLSRVLRVQPLEELSFDPDVWLEAREFGTLLHEVLQTAMDDLCAAGETPSLASRSRLEAIAESALQEWRAVIPPPNEAAYERRRLELSRSVEIFLRNEEEACRQVTPKFFEVSFGFGEESASSIAMPDPVTIPLGGGAVIQLRGRIDRVDHDETKNEWNVWDYKSGGTWDYDRGGSLQKGRKIQHAIYARALEAMLTRKGLTGRVAQSGYFFPTPKGRGARIPRVSPEGELEHALNTLFDVVGRGYFPHADANVCKWCDFSELCGGAETAGSRTAAKVVANGDDPAVAAWVRLQGIR